MKYRWEGLVYGIIPLVIFGFVCVLMIRGCVKQNAELNQQQANQEKGWANLWSKIDSEINNSEFNGYDTILKHIGDLPEPTPWEGGGKSVYYAVGRVKSAKAYGNEYMEINFADKKAILLNAVEPILPGKILCVWGEYDTKTNVFYIELPLKFLYPEGMRKLVGKIIQD